MATSTINRTVQTSLKTVQREVPNKNLELITIKGACKLAQVSRWTIYRWLRMTDDEGNYLIRWGKHGKSKNSPVRIDKASFIAFLESQTVHPQEEEVES